VILKLKNITKKFPGVVALNNISFGLLKGEVHILLGENGAGKSTLVKILSGAYSKDSGEIYLYDKKIEIKNPKHAQEIGIGVIYQELNLIPYLTVAENIFLGREYTNSIGFIHSKKIFKEAKKILDELNVDVDPDALVSTLGTAQQQMVEIARALSLNSKILIMDEPTSSLTKKEIIQLFLTIARLKQKGVTIVYISHRLEEIFQIGDRVTVLRDGNYIGTKNISETDQSSLIKMMVNRELKDHYPKRKAAIGKELLRIDKLSTNELLRNISFNLNEGEILGIYGLLGSGRTELARVIFGADNYETGEIFVSGKSTKINSPAKAIKEGIGFLTEDRKTQGLILDLCVKANICITSLDELSKFGVIDCKSEMQVSDKCVMELKIKTTGSNQVVRSLSGGNQQKVVFAKWLNTDAKIFIFDEPTRGIDIGAKQEIYELMNRLTDKGCGIIMISSELPEILGMSDRVLVMCNGKITDVFDNADLSQELILNSAVGEIYAN
jgi:ribose transport system ATP-binding protein